MNTYVYIDGFNLYYGIRKSGYKWINVELLSQKLPPNENITKIKYYTARVKPRPQDPNQGTRQQIYLRALKTIPNLEVIYGHFLSHSVQMPLADSPDTKVTVIKTEEKGSDVNMATDLLMDGFFRRFEKAVLITNDSDLVRPVQMVREVLDLPVGVINPHPKSPSRALNNVAMFVRDIRKPTLKKCQFPSKLKDSKGPFSKPKGW